MSPWFRQKFQLVGKVTEFILYNESAVQPKIPTYWKSHGSLILIDRGSGKNSNLLEKSWEFDLDHGSV